MNLVVEHCVISSGLMSDKYFVMLSTKSHHVCDDEAFDQCLEAGLYISLDALQS